MFRCRYRPGVIIPAFSLLGVIIIIVIVVAVAVPFFLPVFAIV